MFSRRISRVREGAGLLGTGGLLLFFLGLPLGAVFLEAFIPGLFASGAGGFTLSLLASVLQNGYDRSALLDSVLLGFVSALLGTGIGVALALTVRGLGRPLAAVFDLLIWLDLFTPSFVLAQGWQLFGAPAGLLASWLGVPAFQLPFLFTPVGLAVVLAFKFFPYAYLPVSEALGIVGGELLSAGHSVGLSRRQVLRRILLPLLLPSLLAGTGIIFAEALGDFGVAVTLGQQAHFPLLTYAIYNALYTMPVNYPEASALSIYLGAGVVALMLVQAAILRGRSFAVLSGRSRPPLPAETHRWRAPAAAGVALFFLVALGIPFGTTLLFSLLRQLGSGFTVANLTLAHYQAISQGSGAALAALLRSLRYAMEAAGAAVVIGLIVARAVRRHHTGRRLLEGLLLLTLAIPAVILAAGYIFVWNQQALFPYGLLLYGTSWALLLAYTANSLPYAIRFLSGALAQLHGNMEWAARSLGVGTWRRVRSIDLPLLAGPLFFVWMLSFTGILFELPISEMLYPAGSPTLAVEILHQFNNFRYGLGTALTMVAIALSLLGVAAMKGIFALVRRRYGVRGAEHGSGDIRPAEGLQQTGGPA